jgi:hypothetical protein
MSIGKQRVIEVDWTKTVVTEVNVTLRVMAISKGMEKA